MMYIDKLTPDSFGHPMLGIAHTAAAKLVLVAAVAVLTACQNGAEIDTMEGYVSQSKWVAGAKKDPIISAGDFRENSFWNDPSVIRDGDKYVMYMATSVDDAWQPPILPFRAVSKDGINWTLDPKTPLLSAKETPFENNETPNVVKFKGKYHMYYTGVYRAGDVPSMAIGHAVSEDGITWVNDTKPVLEATGDYREWNGYLVAEPGAVVYKGKIYLYYTAMGSRPGGKPPQLQSIGLVTSSNGIEFDQQRQVLTQSEKYPPEKGFVGYSTPSALAHDGKIHLIYDIAAYGEYNKRQWHQVALDHAVSDDGITNFREDDLPVLTRNDFSWTSGEMIGPSMIISDDKVKLWWSGHVNYTELATFIINGMKGPEVGIGYAELPLEEFLK